MKLLRCHILLLILLSAHLVSMAQHRDEVTMHDSVSIQFPVSKWNLLRSFKDNAAQIDSLDRILAVLRGDSLYRLNRITVIGAASPEGSVAINRTLSNRRAETLFKYIDKNSNLTSTEKEFVFLGRDWAGVLRLAKEDKNLPYKEETIGLLQKITDEKAKNGKEPTNSLTSIKQLRGGVPYRYLLRNIFPKVRSSKVILEYSRITLPEQTEETTIEETPIEIIEEEIVEEEDTVHAVVVADDYVEPEMPDSIEVVEEIVEVIEEKPMIVEKPDTCKPFYMDIHTNMLYDALLLPNIGVEFYLGKNISVGANWMYGWWSNAGAHRYWRAYGGEVYGRWWFGKKAHEKPLTGFHVGAYGQLYTYDFQFGGKGEMGGKPGGNLWDQNLWAAGVEGGYSFPVGKRINIDLSIGLGYTQGLYNEYKRVDDCNVWQRTKLRKYFGPTKAEIALVWLIGKGNVNRRKRAEKGGVR